MWKEKGAERQRERERKERKRGNSVGSTIWKRQRRQNINLHARASRIYTYVQKKPTKAAHGLDWAKVDEVLSKQRENAGTPKKPVQSVKAAQGEVLKPVQKSP